MALVVCRLSTGDTEGNSIFYVCPLLPPPTLDFEPLLGIGVIFEEMGQSGGLEAL